MRSQSFSHQTTRFLPPLPRDAPILSARKRPWVLFTRERMRGGTSEARGDARATLNAVMIIKEVGGTPQVNGRRKPKHLPPLSSAPRKASRRRPIARAGASVATRRPKRAGESNRRARGTCKSKPAFCFASRFARKKKTPALACIIRGGQGGKGFFLSRRPFVSLHAVLNLASRVEGAAHTRTHKSSAQATSIYTRLRPTVMREKLWEEAQLFLLKQQRSLR